MDKFVKGVLPPVTKEQADELFAFAKANGVHRDRVIAQLNEMQHDEVYLNDTYQVNIRKHDGFLHLSVKRLDKEAIFDWRHMQQIKNELTSPESEGVQLFPVESRLVDTANQYHIWVLASEKKFPFGFNQGRLVGDIRYGKNVKQRNFKGK